MNHLVWIAVAVAVEAVLVAAIPRRMLLGAMVIWVLSPVAVYFAVIGGEMVLRPDLSYPPGTALYGLMLISPIIAPPWLALCLVGFGVGSGLRRLFRPSRGRPPVSCQPPVVAATAPHLAQIARRNAPQPPQFVADHRLSPDGTICVEYKREEWLNSHWVNSPRLTDISRGRIVVDLWGDDWDSSIAFPAPRTVRLDLRRYYLGGGIVVEIDLAADTYRLISGTCLNQVGASGSLSALADVLRAWSDRVAESTEMRRHGTVGKPSRWAAWRSALVILVLSMAAIGLLAYLLAHYGPPGAPARAPLATVPPMP